MKSFGIGEVKINGGFWKDRRDVVINSTIRAVYDRFLETGRFGAFKCTYREGDGIRPHIFWDSDVAKWIEGVAYTFYEKKDPELERIIEEVIDYIEKNASEDGYFNSYYMVLEKDGRFTERGNHELYCAGHLIEAAIAYYEATGKERFLRLMKRYADHIGEVFGEGRTGGFVTPGHPEIELALAKLYDVTGEKKYLKLAKHFIDEHGTGKDSLAAFSGYGTPKFNQDEAPVRQRNTAEGHCVRSMYLMCGAADVALRTADSELREACERVFRNVTEKRMYVTGGIGSTWIGEAFTADYDLPNREAYAETCAAISLSMFSERMSSFSNNSVYADTVERVIYNGMLSGMSMDGVKFFYENPLEIDLESRHESLSKDVNVHYPITERVRVFNCSCCPPNLIRYIAALPKTVYAQDEEALFINQFMQSSLDSERTKAEVVTDYPRDGRIRISYRTDREFVAVRIPWWCRSFTISRAYEMRNGYAFVQSDGSGEICLDLSMPVTAVRANRKVRADAGRVCIMRGPVVYCLEGIDNGEDVYSVELDTEKGFGTGEKEFFVPDVVAYGKKPRISRDLYEPEDGEYESVKLKFIPFFAFANRGETDMEVWVLK